MSPNANTHSSNMASPAGNFFRTVDGKLNDMSVLICNAHGELRGAWLHLHDTLHLYRLDLATDEQKDQAEAQFERAFQVLEVHVREQRSTTLAIVHAAANKYHQQYQVLQHENERLQQHVRALSPPSPASKVTLPLPGYVSVCQHYITEYCIEKRDPITGKRII